VQFPGYNFIFIQIGVGAHIQEQQENVLVEMPAVMFLKDIW
jgi:hypothetical protein